MKYIIKFDNGLYYGKINYAGNTEYLTTKSDAKRFKTVSEAEQVLNELSVPYMSINSAQIEDVEE